jgi:hypothetical protein
MKPDKKSPNLNVLGIITGQGLVIIHDLSLDKSFFSTWHINPTPYSIVISIGTVIFLLKVSEELRQQIKTNNRNNKMIKGGDHALIEQINNGELTNKEKYDLMLLLYTTTNSIREENSPVSGKKTTEPTAPKKGKWFGGILKLIGFSSK